MKLNTLSISNSSLESLKSGSSCADVLFKKQPRLRFCIVLVFMNLIPIGCGKQETNPQVQREPGLESSPPPVPPTVSIDAPVIQLDLPETKPAKPMQTAMVSDKPTQPETPKIVQPQRAEKGSILWLLEEISLHRTSASDFEVSKAQNENGQIAQLSQTQIQEHREISNRKIIELAQAVIVKTHQQPEQVNSFNTAVLALADARLQLAIAGHTEQSRLLSEDAEALYSKDANSFAATEAAYKLLQFTQVQAQSLAAKDSKWALAFARQSRLFAKKFPNETNRAAIHLVAAGRICDKIGMTDEAKNCLMVVEERFPDSPFSEQVKNTLRRLRLPGQELKEFGGSTIDGNYLSIDQFRGRPVVIVFWASNSILFKEDMQLINDTVKSTGNTAAVVGVNLDRDELAAERFIGMNENHWPHIFYSAADKRGMENLIAKYYGVSKVPSYWLVDAQGIVKTVNLKPTDLGQHLSEMNAVKP